MATHQTPIMGPNTLPESGVFFDMVGNQITATNEVGNQLALVMADGGSDVGIHGNFTVPQNYVGTGKIIVKGILDGVMTSKTLAFGVQGIAREDNEAVDAAYSTEDLGNVTADHADEDLFKVEITLSNLTGLAAGDTVFYYFFIDASVNDYAGNVLITDLLLQFADA